jgi:lipoate-protein ligase A
MVEGPRGPAVLEVVRSTGPVTVDLARESWMLERAAAGHCTMMLASWPSPVVVLGYAQPTEDVDLEMCRRRAVPVVRRVTGGTGVVHDRDLAVSLALPATHPWAGGIVSLYDRFLDVLEPALQGAGSRLTRPGTPSPSRRDRSPICFEDRLADTLMVNGAKAVGCAQTRRRGGVLIHAAILCRLDVSLVAAVFGVEPERVRRNLAPALDPARREIAEAAIVEGVAGALDAIAVDTAPGEVPTRLLDVYRQARWAPLPLDAVV